MSIPCPSCHSGLQVPVGSETGLCRQCGEAFVVVADEGALYLVPLRPEAPETAAPEGGDGPEGPPLPEDLEPGAPPPEEANAAVPGSEPSPHEPEVAPEPPVPQPSPEPAPLPEAPPSRAGTDLAARVRAARVQLSRLLARVPRSTWQTVVAGGVGALVVLLLGRGFAPPEAPRTGLVQVVPAGTLDQETLPYPRGEEPTAPPLAGVPVAAAPGLPTPTPTPAPTGASGAASPAASPSPGPSPSPSPRLQAAPPLPAVGRVNGEAVQAPRASAGSRTRGPAEEPEETPVEEEAAPAPSAGASPTRDLLGERRQDREEPRREDFTSKPFLLVTRVERSRGWVMVWALLMNKTNQNLDYEPYRLLDPSGAQFERGSWQNWDLSGGTLKPGWYLTMHPLFEPLDGQEPGRFVLPTEEFGNLEVPAAEKMSNYGPWESLPEKVRTSVEETLRREEGFRWWGLSSLPSHPVPAPTSRQGPPGY